MELRTRTLPSLSNLSAAVGAKRLKRTYVCAISVIVVLALLLLEVLYGDENWTQQSSDVTQHLGNDGVVTLVELMWRDIQKAFSESHPKIQEMLGPLIYTWIFLPCLCIFTYAMTWEASTDGIKTSESSNSLIIHPDDDANHNILDPKKLSSALVAAQIEVGHCTIAEVASHKTSCAFHGGSVFVMDSELSPEKLLDIRSLVGMHCFKVAFREYKHSNIQEAMYLLKMIRFNLMVARFTPLNVTLIITSERGALPLSPEGKIASSQLVECVLRRANVSFWPTKVMSSASLAPLAEQGKDEAAYLLQVALTSGLFTSARDIQSGSLSHRSSCRHKGPCHDIAFWGTPRLLDKSQLLVSDLLLSDCNVSNQCVRSWPEENQNNLSSIDSGVQGIIYHQLPWIQGLVHFHYGHGLVVIADFATSYPYPCGCIEEADLIFASWQEAAQAGAVQHGDSFLIELVQHGYVCALGAGGAYQLLRDWESAQANVDRSSPPFGLHRHFTSGNNWATCFFHPIFIGPRIVGCVIQATCESATSEMECIVSRACLNRESKSHEATVMETLISRGDCVVANAAAFNASSLPQGTSLRAINPRIDLFILEQLPCPFQNVRDSGWKLPVPR